MQGISKLVPELVHIDTMYEVLWYVQQHQLYHMLHQGNFKSPLRGGVPLITTHMRKGGRPP